MSDKKKPGAPNIKDLKAKLGLKTPGGATPGGGLPPPPLVSPPPGVPPTTDPFGGPGGIEPPMAVRPPPGVTPPPGIVPPAVTPPPGVAPPAITPHGGNLVAPPGFHAPAPTAAQAPAFASVPEPVEVDFGAVEGKKKKKVVWIFLALGACLLSMCGGYYFGDARLQRDWMKKSKSASVSTSEVIKKLEQGTRQFEAVLEQEVEKTKHGAQPFAYYNPDLFTKLDEQASGFDVNNPALRKIMNEQIWTTHYRFVKNAAELLPRLHTFLALCAQIKTVVDTGRSVESKYSEILAKKTRTAKEEASKTPQFGVMIRGDKDILFFALGDPVDGEGKKVDKHEDAAGYMLPNARPAYFGKTPTKAGECPEVNGSIRIFAVDDGELKTRLKCQGQEDVVFEAWVAQIAQIKVLLKQLETVNPRDLYQQFQKSSGK